MAQSIDVNTVVAMGGTPLDGYSGDERWHRAQLNAWRRSRFAQFPYRPGQQMTLGPDGYNYLQGFFQTSEDRIPAFYRNRLVAGGRECLGCDGTGAAISADDRSVLVEHVCRHCGGSGSSTEKIYRQREPGAAGVPYAHTGHHHSGRAAEPQPDPAEQQRRERRRRTSPPVFDGRLRGAVGFAVFVVLSCLISQPLLAVAGDKDAATFVALLAGAAGGAGAGRLIFGPLRGSQVLGPLWILVLPVYLLCAGLFLLSFAIESLDKSTLDVWEMTYTVRESLSKVPLGR
ncbi:hypothetical protein [Actinoplanes sp. HUAS TT8]|uniref:hypothetical protein n=1 Tax=Actinoplanes sp. HUAS TT8 TaxID=3447453 RepID=UPI003F51D3E5